MPKLKYGDTYFCTYQGRTQHHIYRPGLITVLDPKQSATPPQYQGVQLCQFQPYPPNRSSYHWISEQYIREATPSDFSIGDIITENVLSVFDCEIIEIKPVRQGVLTDPPIVADQLDELGIRSGNVFHMEPSECIMVAPLNEPTLDLYLLEGEEPRNNDGRKRCYWCRGATKRVPGFNLDIYDICTKCGR